MCTHSRLVYNRYVRQMVPVSCGKCPACLEQKAIARQTRIRNQAQRGELPLFVTLTYANDYIPFVHKSDIDDMLCGNRPDVPVYRDRTVRFYKRRLTRPRPLSKPIDSMWFDRQSADYDSSRLRTYSKSPNPDRVAVCYYKDVQNFMKRLRINLQRYYNYEYPISYYSCSEYGPTTNRPHFHLLIYVRADSYKEVQSCINESWPFADRARTSRYVQVARDASGYVASYVCSSNSAANFYAKTAFRQKHSYSKGFGYGNPSFSLGSVLEKVRKGTLDYSVTTFVQGVPCVSSVPLPKYIVNRYFPKFRGFALLSESEVRELLLVPRKMLRYIHQRSVELGLGKSTYDYDEKLLHEWSVRLFNCIERYKRVTGRNPQDYVFDYLAAWRAYTSTVFKYSFSGIRRLDDFSDFYYNGNELALGLVDSDLRFSLDLSSVTLNPNSRKDVVLSSVHLTETFFKKDKSRKVVNFSLSAMGHNV